MVNPFRDVNWSPGRRERRRFAASLMIGLPMVAGVLLVAGRLSRGDTSATMSLAVGGGGFTLGLLLWCLPNLAWPFYLVWHGIACALGLVIANLMLVAVYLLLVTPTGWAVRLGRRSAIRKGIDPGASSYWREAPPPDDPVQYYRQF